MAGRDPLVRELADRVARTIGEVTPADLGAHGWDFSRAYVQPYENPYLDGLNEWRAEDTPDTRETLQRAVELYVGAWKRAGEEWQRAGCPGAPSREAVPV
jgi:hypothetical protein